MFLLFQVHTGGGGGVGGREEKLQQNFLYCVCPNFHLLRVAQDSADLEEGGEMLMVL